MGARHMDYPSPRGVHVPETYYASDPDDPYRRPPSQRNRYSRSVHQTPRTPRDVTWISSPDRDPAGTQRPYEPATRWLPSPHRPSSPAHRPPSAIPPSPAPTVGEHMTVDDFAFTADDLADPYHLNQLQRPSLIKSFWRGLKRQFSGIHPDPPFPMPRPSSMQGVGMPVSMPMPMPGPSAPSEATQYVDPTPPETVMGAEEQRNAARYSTPYVRPASIGGTPATIPGSLRASPAPSMNFAPPITVISPSPPSSPSSPSSSHPHSTRSARMPSPRSALRTRSVGMPEPGPAFPEGGSRTPHEPAYADPALPPLDLPLTSAPIHVAASDEEVKFPSPPRGNRMHTLPVERSSSKGSLSSTMARFRRFVAELDDLPWSDTQIADEYIPEQNPRSRMRTRVRQGAEPSWYNERPQVVERPEYWSEWDMWAKQSAAALWDGTRRENGRVGWDGAGRENGRVGWAGVGAGGLGQGQFGAVYPHGYVPVQPQGFVYPSGYPPPGVVNGQGHAPVLP